MVLSSPVAWSQFKRSRAIAPDELARDPSRLPLPIALTFVFTSRCCKITAEMEDRSLR